jgi:hypothetical protein
MRCKKYCSRACTNLGRCNPCRLANRYKILELFPIAVTGPPVIHSSSLPFCLRFKMALRAQGSYKHPARLDTVSARRLGVWLALTQAGFPPACQSTISSPQVHRFVRRLCATHQTLRSGGQDHSMRHYCRLRIREPCRGQRTMLFGQCTSAVSPCPDHRIPLLSVIPRVSCRPLTKFRSTRSVGYERFPNSVLFRECSGLFLGRIENGLGVPQGILRSRR